MTEWEELQTELEDLSIKNLELRRELRLARLPPKKPKRRRIKKGKMTDGAMLRFIKTYWSTHCISPSVDDIAKHFGTYKRGVWARLREMETDGLLRPIPAKMARAIRPVGMRVEFDDVVGIGKGEEHGQVSNTREDEPEPIRGD